MLDRLGKVVGGITGTRGFGEQVRRVRLRKRPCELELRNEELHALLFEVFERAQRLDLAPERRARSERGIRACEGEQDGDARAAKRERAAGGPR